MGGRQPKACYEHGQSEGVRLAIEPLNRFETYFLNRHDQALALAEDVGPECGVCLDVFHMNIEEKDMLPGDPQAGKGRLADFHVADNNRMALRHGRLDWGQIIGTLKEIGYDGALTVEFVAPLDRTPANPYTNVIEKGPVEHHGRRAEVHRGPRHRRCSPTSSTPGSSTRRSRRCGSTCERRPCTCAEPFCSSARLTPKGRKSRTCAIGCRRSASTRSSPTPASSASRSTSCPTCRAPRSPRLGGTTIEAPAQRGQPRQGGARDAAGAAAARARPATATAGCRACATSAAPKARSSAPAR